MTPGSRVAQRSGQVLVFFDIDGTLLSGRSSERRFFDFLRAHNAINASRWALFASFLLTQWVRFGINVGRKNKAYLNNLERDDIEQLASSFVQTELMQSLMASSLRRLRWHQAQGHRIVLLSGTLQEIADALGAALDVPDVIGTRCSMTGSRFNSSAPWRHPYGSEKLSIAATLSAAAGADLDNAFAYGDSHKDRFLMRAVGNPVAVEPDRWLHRLASRSGWEVLKTEQHVQD